MGSQDKGAGIYDNSFVSLYKAETCEDGDRARKREKTA